jgi:hypothetical protein
MILKPFLSLIILFGLLPCLATAAPQPDCPCSRRKGSNGRKGLNARSPMLPGADGWPKYKVKKSDKITLPIWDPIQKKWKIPVQKPAKKGIFDAWKKKSIKELWESLDKEAKLKELDQQRLRDALADSELTIKQISKSPPTINVKFINRSPFRLCFNEYKSPMDAHAFENGLFSIIEEETKNNFAVYNESSETVLDDTKNDRSVILAPNQTVEQNIELPGKNVRKPGNWLRMLKAANRVTVRLEAIWPDIKATEENSTDNTTELGWAYKLYDPFKSNEIELHL